jgi:hypothetical protein
LRSPITWPESAFRTAVCGSASDISLSMRRHRSHKPENRSRCQTDVGHPHRSHFIIGLSTMAVLDTEPWILSCSSRSWRTSSLKLVR